MKRLLVLLIAAGLSQAAETLRVSAVVETDTPDAKEMPYQTATGEQRVWVSNKAIITEKDVKHAGQSMVQEKTIDVQLTEKGTAAMVTATAPMRPGIDRMAIIVEGKLHSAPVLRSVPLGKSFIIEGFAEYDDRQLTNLARGMMGQPPLGPDEAVPAPPPAGPVPPRPKLVPYTEEEIQAIKQQRERFGIYQLDRLPDQAELDKTLHQGMTADEVIAIYGKPTRHNRKPERKEFYLEYEIAPERRPDKPDGHMVPESFKVEFRDSKVASWGSGTWSDAPRELKNENQVPGLLKGIFPSIDMAAEDFNFVTWIEGIRIPDLNAPVSQGDLASLLGSLFLYSTTIPSDSNKDDTIRADCDVLKILGKYVPDLAKLTAAKDGKIPLADLHEAVRPFIVGKTPIPDPKSPAGQ